MRSSYILEKMRRQGYSGITFGNREPIEECNYPNGITFTYDMWSTLVDADKEDTMLESLHTHPYFAFFRIVDNKKIYEH